LRGKSEKHFLHDDITKIIAMNHGFVYVSGELINKMKLLNVMAVLPTCTRWPKSGAMLVKLLLQSPLIIPSWAISTTRPQIMWMQQIAIRSPIQMVLVVRSEKNPFFQKGL
jgi:hypothetical protein